MWGRNKWKDILVQKAPGQMFYRLGLTLNRANKCNVDHVHILWTFLLFVETNKICGLSDPDRMLVIRKGRATPSWHIVSLSLYSPLRTNQHGSGKMERKRKEWRSRFDPVGNLSGSAKLVSEKRVGRGSVSRWQLWVGNYSHPFLLYGIHFGVI